jgi:putative holliday junction resolvase
VRAAAVDLGRIRVGLAISDELGLMAHPRPFLDGKNIGQVVKQLTALCESEGVDVFVVGLPRLLDGQEGTAARKARQFAMKLREVSRCRVVLVDERLTTRQAHDRLAESGLDGRERRTRVDSASAALLLQTFLDAHRGGRP